MTTTNLKSNLPTPDTTEVARLQQQKEFLEKEQTKLIQQVLIMKENNFRIHEEKRIYIKRIKSLIIAELKKLYEWKRKVQPLSNHKINDLILKIALKKQFLHRQLTEYKQDVQIMRKIQHQFIRKQLKELQLQLQMIFNEEANNEVKNKLKEEESRCLMARQNWPLLLRRYQPVKLIGKGGFSEVYLGYDVGEEKISSGKVAVKVSNIQMFRKGLCEQYVRHVTRQCEVLRQLSHPCIARLISFTQLDQHTLCLILEYCQGIQLSRYLQQKKLLTQNEVRGLAWQLISAIKYLSGMKVVHFDLKPQNIMINEGMIKVLDFGLCKALENEHSQMALTSQGAGTYWYLPPQAFRQKDPTVSNKVDIWSVGVIIYQLITGRRPYGHGLSQKRVFETGAILHAGPVQFPSTVQISQQCKEFISLCLEVNESKRIHPCEAQIHPFFDLLKSN